MLVIKDREENLSADSVHAIHISEHKDSFQESTVRKDMSKMSPIGLLEILQREVGCMYISDLHAPYNLPRIHCALKKFEPGRYDIREWNDVFYYITGQAENFSEQRRAAEHLAHYTCALTPWKL